MKLEYDLSALIIACAWLLSCVQFFATSWTVARHAPLSIRFSRKDYWSGLPFSSPGDLPNPGTEPGPPALLADSLPSEPPGKPIICGRLRKIKMIICDS